MSPFPLPTLKPTTKSLLTLPCINAVGVFGITASVRR
ncbi:hypothetical protein EVA_07927 [gut metagenome]|uniref:Uncharacterized protein n=1 Tax=gut metagenome TaxID=749906 RepID=J9G9K5_9ZZZZ